jgi:uncharacterized protein YjbI with pentapeptide repeats
MTEFSFYKTDGSEITSTETEGSVLDALNALLEAGVDFSDANLQNLTLDGLQAGQARLYRADLSMCSLKNATFRQARLQGVRFNFADLSGSDFTGCQIDADTDWSGAVMLDTFNEEFPGEQPVGTTPLP